jgi:ADP-ribose 1''-phosphate phosphatase
VHATNCLSIWGSGFAAELARMFPAAYERYRVFCSESRLHQSDRWPAPSLAGKCLIIPPQEADVAKGAPRVSIVCVFTSYGYGRPNKSTGKAGLDSQSKNIEQTVFALRDFRRQLDQKRAEGGMGDVVIYSPRFNSGAFRVPWEKTTRTILNVFHDFQATWNYMIPPGSS